jgi:peptidoglycan hydrolase-like protein with peptidoglycan-binding domain
VRHAVATCLMGAVGAACLPAVATAQPAPPAAVSAPAISSVATVAALPAAAPAVVPGARGSHIVALQQALIARGHAIPAGATGYYGSQTRAAVAAFQRAQGWRGSGADGIPGPKTLARLGLGAAAKPAAKPHATPASAGTARSLAGAGQYAMGARGNHVKALQQALIARGHRIPAGATGYYGSQTKAAVASFQRSQGWRGSGADGIPGPQTLARLSGAAPTRAIAAGNTAVPAPTGAVSPATFVSRYGPMARSAGSATGVPALVTLAQAALESGWGSSAAGNNFFGVKARASDSARMLRTTREILSSPDVRTFPQVISVSRRSDGLYTYEVREWFRTYPSAEQSFVQHNQLLRTSRYSAAFRYAGDPYRFATAIAAAGYATDPSYTAKLHAVMRLIERHGFR